MNTLEINLTIEDPKLRNTIYDTIDVEMVATKTDRGYVKIDSHDNGIRLTIFGKDYVAVRAMTNSILRLVKTSVDVTETLDDILSSQ